VNDLLQKDPLRRPDANYLVETVPDFIDFITDSNWVQESGELESSNDDLLNRLVFTIEYILFLFLCTYNTHNNIHCTVQPPYNVIALYQLIFHL